MRAVCWWRYNAQLERRKQVVQGSLVMGDEWRAEQWLRDQIAAARDRGDHRQAERLLAQHEQELRDRLRKRVQAPDRDLYHERARSHNHRPDR